jgi:Zn-dependent protease/predicted transcriptional regulator
MNSLRIGSISGISVYLHWTFLLFLGWIGISGFIASGSGAAAVGKLALVGLLFLIVLLHELGHCFMARRYGIGTHEITLLPIGGLARLERMPDDPVQEFMVAIAGPAVNVVLAVLFFVILRIQGELPPLLEGAMGSETLHWLAGGGVLQTLFNVNVMLVLFNLLPAFPMDGGRVLRAILATRMEHVQATRIAAGVGQAMAFVFAMIGLFGNPFLIFIAFFVWIGAEGEVASAEVRSSLSGFRTKNAMITNFQTLSEDDTLGTAVQHILAGFQQDFPVLRGENVVGVLAASNILRGLGQHGQGALAKDIMETNFATVDAEEHLERAFEKLQECKCSAVPVVKSGHLVGMLTLENVGEFITVQNTLRARSR